MGLNLKNAKKKKKKVKVQN